jgi:hypothetical protein
MENEIISHPTERSYVLGGAMTKQNSTLRIMTPYCVFENELDNISTLNTQMVIFNSVGSFLLSAFVTVFVTLMTLESIKPEIQMFLRILGYLFLGLSLVFFSLSWLSWRSKKSEWKRIKDSTRIIQTENQK